MRALATIVLVLTVLTLPSPAAAAPLTPLDPHIANWERIFKLDWERGQWRGRQVVRGYLTNDSPYPVRRVQLLVEALDEAGVVKGRTTAVLHGDVLPATRHYFEVGVGVASPRYRVIVYSFERIEAGGEIR